ncbi:MAG: hypothetical protein WAU36_04055 [Cyclobacteriaceae bacterium]
MLNKDNNFSIPTNGLSQPGINPKTNFLLKKAALIANIQDEVDNELTLYKLHNGNFAVHTRYSNKLRNDTLVKVDLYQVAKTFKLKHVV